MLAPVAAMAQPSQTPALDHAPAQRAVLVLAVDDATRPWTRMMTDGLREVMQESAPDVAIYTEALDSTRFGGAGYTDDARDWLARKYRDVPLDRLLVIGQDAVAFLAEANGEPWKDVPVLYMDSGALTIDISSSLPLSSGIVLENSFATALTIMLDALPDTRRIAVVYGASAIERERYALSIATIGRLHPRIEVIDLGGLAIDELLARVAVLPEHTVVLNFTIQVDANGRTFAPNRPCELLSAAANRPLFTLGTFDFGCGTVGGLLRDWALAGRALGTRAVHLLDGGEPATTIVPMGEYCRLLFDARQLERWGISEARLPAGSVVEFRPRSLWRDYRREVIIALVLGLVAAALIVGLLLEHRRRQRAEIQAQRHLTAMAHLDRRGAMGELAASLAHELNQPLNAILQNAGVAEMLLASAQSDEAIAETREILGDIRKDDLRASDIIGRMRRLLQKRELDLGSVDPAQLVRETIALVRSEAARRDIRIESEADDALPVIRGDRVHLQQVLLNLVLNAMDAVATAPTGRREIAVQAAVESDRVRFAVRDRGTGLPEGPSQSIFEPFVTTKPNGMGMGLAIAHGIVLAHDGRMGAADNPDAGATVWFEIPIRAEAPQ